MDTLKEFQKMMAEQTDLALATVGADGIPNVRVVNYYFNPENNVIYFATFKNNNKVNEHIKAKGIAIKSKKSIFDLADCFCEKIPDYRETIEYGGKSLIVYEIHFKTATVVLDLSNIKTLKL